MTPNTKNEKLLKRLNELATNYFQSLFKESEKGLAARDYLKGRHFDGEILDQYKIGWAIPEWRGLTNHLRKTSNLSRKTVLQSGLVIEKEEGSNIYDRFRGRVIFPIQDAHGSVIGFGGRAISESDQPKYLNSLKHHFIKKVKFSSV